jgi:hypothetical protein
MTMKLYAYASPHGIDTYLFRLGGVGVGNLLFPWARCAIYCRHGGATQIYTTWPQIKPGAWLRMEQDKRHYFHVFRPLPDEIRGARKLQLLHTTKRVNENCPWSEYPDSPRTVFFRGLGNYFLDLQLSDRAWLRERFLAMISDRRLVERTSDPHIGVHIRRGDMPPYQADIQNTGTMRLPLSWYAHVIRRVCTQSGWTGEIGVCSDGTETELAEILRLPNVRLVRGKTALHDLMYLAASHLIIGSVSTFSQWAAYFSGSPSIWHPSFDRNGGLGGASTEVVMSESRPPDPATWQKCMNQAFNEL